MVNRIKDAVEFAGALFVALFTLAFFLVPVIFDSAAKADSWQRPPQPYDLVGVRLSWQQIPYPRYGYEYPTGWELLNPEGWACEPCYDSRHWFKCRVRVDPLIRKLTILNAVECDEP
jgi:hypothetical protein